MMFHNYMIFKRNDEDEIFLAHLSFPRGDNYEIVKIH